MRVFLLILQLHIKIETDMGSEHEIKYIVIERKRGAGVYYAQFLIKYTE